MKRHAKSLQKKAKLHRVYRRDQGYYRVLSSSSGESYHVRKRSNGGYSCHCSWAEEHRADMEPCSHALAVMQRVDGTMSGKRLSFWSTLEDAKRQHRPIQRIGLGLWATSRALGR